MLGLALLLSTLATAPASALLAPAVRPEESVGHLAGFLVQVDLHGNDSDRLLISATSVEQQIAATLRSSGIDVVEVAPSKHPPVHSGTLILDVHVIGTDPGAALAWTLHASQNVLVLTGAWAFASTWEVGDLLVAPLGEVRDRLRDSLQPALDDFCKAYRSARPPPPGDRAPSLGL